MWDASNPYSNAQKVISENLILPQNPQFTISQVGMVPKLKWENKGKIGKPVFERKRRPTQFHAKMTLLPKNWPRKGQERHDYIKNGRELRWRLWGIDITAPESA